MSGEAGGVLIGGAIALALAPVVITGAAALGLAYGAIRVGGYLGKHALDYAAEKKREKELVVGQCSVQLDSLFSQMRSVVREETDAHTRYAEQISKQFRTIGTEMKAVYDQKPSVEVLDRKIANSRTIINQKLSEEGKVVRRTIIEKGQKQISQCIEVIEKSNAEKAEIIKWADKSVTAVSMQKNVAAEMLRDADAAYHVLDNMAKSSNDHVFRNQVHNIQTTLQRAKAMMDQEMFQSAFSNARTVIRESAILAGEHVQNELEMDMLVMELKAKVEGLAAELKAQRYLEFCDETKRNKKKIKVDLYNFSQGKYKKMLDTLQELSAKLDREGSSTSVYEVEKMMKHFEDEVEPEARHIVDYSYKIMKGYYDRLHALEIVADFMTEQDYQMDWAMPVGGDVSQKLVVHFVQKMTGNTISVTLDNDIESGDIAKMAMEILTFYGNGRPVTENEKKELRDNLNAALNKAGFSGALGCQGHVNQSSDQVEMNKKETVKNMPTTQIV